jgi:serum/glucocorticoid-regulated kinase 2
MDSTKSFCGSPAYLAPEMLKNKGTGKAADIYGLGAVLFEMLTGNPPFYNEDIPKLYKNIQEAKLEIPENINDEAADLLMV